jgi:hypothetical protein
VAHPVEVNDISTMTGAMDAALRILMVFIDFKFE